MCAYNSYIGNFGSFRGSIVVIVSIQFNSIFPVLINATWNYLAKSLFASIASKQAEAPTPSLVRVFRNLLNLISLSFTNFAQSAPKIAQEFAGWEASQRRASIGAMEHSKHAAPLDRWWLGQSGQSESASGQWPQC